MKGRVRFTSEELRHIGLRMRAVRILTGFNQEEFSEKYEVPYISLKNWEQGRFTPRQESMFAFLKAIDNEGIKVDPDWIYFGRGPGPTYYLVASTKNPEQTESTSKVSKEYIEYFKKQQISAGLNPVISFVEDSSMMPDFKKGDILGGMLLSRQEILDLSLQQMVTQKQFLILENDGKFYPRNIFISDDRIFSRSNEDHRLNEYKHNSLAKISWYYSGS